MNMNITNRDIKVLLIEDNPGDVRLIREHLTEVKDNFILETADLLARGLARLTRGDIDIVLLDLSLPDSNGLDTFTKTNAMVPGTPIVVLTGYNDENLAVKTVREGAQDYLIKGQVDGNLLARSMRYAIERKRAEEELRLSWERFNKAFNASPSPMLILSFTDGRFLSVNDSFLRFIKTTREEVIGHSIMELDLWMVQEEQDLISQMITQGKTLNNQELSLKVTSGEVRIVILSAEIIGLNNEQCLLVVLNDITERIQLERVLRKLSYLDGLTSIANRRHFEEVLSTEWYRALRDSRPISLLLMDLDYFKAYNDTYGHLRGDDCLKQVANIISKTVKRPGDLVARYGGEEFVVILPNTDNCGATIVANKMRHNVESLRIPHTGSLVSDYVTISIGTATLIPEANQSTKILMEAADTALYQAKNHGRNRIFTMQVKKDSIDRLSNSNC